jgi:hypothetical protein
MQTQAPVCSQAGAFLFAWQCWRTRESRLMGTSALVIYFCLHCIHWLRFGGNSPLADDQQN